MKSLLSVKHLEVNYGAIKAVKGITFDIKEGEIVSLIGSNGAGKTSTLRAISGLLKSSGEVIFNEVNLQTTPVEKRIALGLATSPEGRGVFPQLSVLENLEMGAYFRKDSYTKELEKVFALFPRLKERTSQAAGTLSGGEQQMLAISRALMAKPKLLLLDEPSLGLAPIIVAQIFSIVTQLNKDEGMTILLVEQNAKQALKISHRAYVLETGLISLSGTGHELLNNDEVQRCYLGM